MNTSIYTRNKSELNFDSGQALLDISVHLLLIPFRSSFMCVRGTLHIEASFSEQSKALAALGNKRVSQIVLAHMLTCIYTHLNVELQRQYLYMED